MQKNIYFKTGSIFIIILLLMIPSGLIMNLIRERQARSSIAQSEVFEKWGAQQSIKGPILKIPFKNEVKKQQNQNGTIVDIISYQEDFIYLTPETLQISGDLKTQEKHRGIYEVAVYEAQTKIKTQFPEIKEWMDQRHFKHVDWKNIELIIGINDLKGLKEVPKAQIGEQVFSFENRGYIRGIGNALGSPLKFDPNSPLLLNLQLNFKGSQGIAFTPIGKTTEVALKANWGTPSFQGTFIPEQHSIQDSAFQSYWKVLDLNRNLPEYWQGEIDSFEELHFGVELMISSDNYLKTERTIKYALLLITLSFITFFMTEMIQKISIHPIQYLLVGASIISFYTLLLSLSEQIGFNLAYLAAALATIILIVWYLKFFFKSKQLTIFNSLFLSTLYAFIFILVQMEDYALLVGSCSLFIILGSIMYFSRKIDWSGKNE